MGEWDGARGKRSLEGRRGYAYDVAEWIDFLHDAYGIDYLDTEFEDLDDYGRELRTTSENPVSGGTWNRKLAAIHDFYRSLVRDGRLAPGDGPFAAPGADRELRSRAVGARTVRYLSLAQLRYFVEVGMRGYRPDGTIGTAFRGGYPGRDGCMANVLATTGMRWNEMRSLTTVEVDPGAPAIKGRRVVIGAPAKGGRQGQVIVPRRTLEGLRADVEGDRDVIVSVANSTDSLRKREPTMIVVEELDESVAETVKGYDRAAKCAFAKPVSATSGPGQRRRADRRQARRWEPLALFVGEGGVMVSGSLVNRVFESTLVRGLSLLDSVLLLVSGIIGSSIFLTAKDIAGPLPQPMLFLLVWVLGAVISLFGCVAFAELGSMFPDSGGQYVYLREAYGDLSAFLYGWMLFSVANGGTIAALCVASAAYMGHIVPVISQDHIVLSLAGITLTRAHVVGLLLITMLTYVNVVGLRWGALYRMFPPGRSLAPWRPSLAWDLPLAKDTGRTSADTVVGLSMGLGPGQFISAMGVGLIAVFWAYDGWVYITWVAGEVKEPTPQCAAGDGVGHPHSRRDLHGDEHDLCLRHADERNRQTRNHRACGRGRAFFSACRPLALRHDRTFLLQCGRHVHALGGAGFACHGAGWRFFQAHGGDPSQMAHPGFRPDRTGHLGRGPGSERAL